MHRDPHERAEALREHTERTYDQLYTEEQLADEQRAEIDSQLRAIYTQDEKAAYELGRIRGRIEGLQEARVLIRSAQPTGEPFSPIDVEQPL